jgi:hypothetical protein
MEYSFSVSIVFFFSTIKHHTSNTAKEKLEQKDSRQIKFEYIGQIFIKYQ